MYEQLELEQQLVMHLSRLHQEVDEKEVREILEKEIDWNLVFEYGNKNKVIYLIYYNMKQLGIDKFVPKYLSSLLEDAFYCNKVRNAEKLEELDKVLSIFKEQGVACVPVKGGYLIDNVYNNRSARVTNDIDALILKKDIKKIECILTDLGYIVGEVNRRDNSIILVVKKRCYIKLKCIICFLLLNLVRLLNIVSLFLIYPMHLIFL